MKAENMDPVTDSVAAYSSHIDEYTEFNANKVEKEVATFAAHLPKGADVLDLGCGPGRDLRRFRAQYGFNAVGVDLNPDFVARAAEFGPAHVADMRDLPFADNSFDGVWACASLVHLPKEDAHKALAEITRVTKSGGMVYVSVKIGGTTGWQETAHGRRYFEIWDREQFTQTVQGAGITVIDGCFDELWTNIYGIVN